MLTRRLFWSIVATFAIATSIVAWVMVRAVGHYPLPMTQEPSSFGPSPSTRTARATETKRPSPVAEAESASQVSDVASGQSAFPREPIDYTKRAVSASVGKPLQAAQQELANRPVDFERVNSLVQQADNAARDSPVGQLVVRQMWLYVHVQQRKHAEALLDIERLLFDTELKPFLTAEEWARYSETVLSLAYASGEDEKVVSYAIRLNQLDSERMDTLVTIMQSYYRLEDYPSAGAVAEKLLQLGKREGWVVRESWLRVWHNAALRTQDWATVQRARSELCERFGREDDCKPIVDRVQ